MSGSAMLTRFVVAAAVALASVSCGDLVRQGRAPVFLVIDQLTAGGNSFLMSDVEVLRRSPAPCSATAPCPTILNDTGSVTLRLLPKDVTASGGLGPSSNSAVTINRYRVTYRRSDGRNTPGVDVPFPFDGAVTGTVSVNGTVSLGFELVRHVAKQEAPLAQLVANGVIITTHTEVTFYGRDQVGNDISVSGLIQVDFGNFAD